MSDGVTTGNPPFADAAGAPCLADSVLDLIRALADSTRLRIVALLRQLELAVGEIALVLDQSQPRVSRHIRLLEEAGLVERRREGSWVFVRLTVDTAGARLLDAIHALPPFAADVAALDADRRRLGVVLAEREAAAQRYFAAHAQDWDGIRSLHVAEAEVESAIRAMAGERPLGHLLDIGTGTGQMVAVLGDHATRVTALDRSPEMLRLARSRLAGGQTPVELVLGDFLALPLPDGSVDSVVMHQALHYAAAPGRVIREIGRVLGPSGVAMIIDFAPHEHEELRRDAAHAWLGFADSQIREWMTAANLVLDSTVSLTGGALTVKLWLGRRRRSGRSATMSDQRQDNAERPAE